MGYEDSAQDNEQGIAGPSPRMEEFTDTPIVVPNLARNARFRTQATPAIKAELEIDLAKPSVNMCSVQLTFPGGSTTDPASFQDKLIAIGMRVVKSLG